MTEVASSREVPLPRLVPALLSFVAGYVDIYTFLALFGLFVAQVTGSLVTAGAELVAHDIAIAGKLVAVAAFLFAAALAAGLIELIRDLGRAALPWMLACESALLAAFTALMLGGPPINGAADWRGILAGLLAAMAMGTQSVIVRLLMRGVPQTNVMTGNMTQLGCAITDIIVAKRRFARSNHDAAAIQHYHAVRDQLLVVLSVAIGFLVGAAAGAVAFVAIGISGALLSVALVVALALWSLARGDAA